MNMCEKFELDVQALARGEWMSAKTRTAALEHVDACPNCSRKLAKEQMLTAGLAALQEADERQARVPDHLESLLLLEFRKAMSPVPVRKRSRQMIIAAAAAAVVLAVWAGWPKVKLVFQPATAPVNTANSHAARSHTGGPVREFSETSSDFLVLPYAPSLGADENAEIYRVRVPRATVSGLGLPVRGRSDEAVEADLVVGPDGVARAIRFIR